MATPLYDALVAKVRDWSNRDAETLPETIIKDALDYAADNTYRTMRVPALEATVTYTIPEADDGGECLTIPDDLTEFISVRRIDLGANGYGGAGRVENRTIVYDQKADYRTFRDLYDQQYSLYRWTRHEGDILVNPTYSTGEEYELHYYRRLPALNARYQVNTSNYEGGLLERQTEQDGSVGNPLYFEMGVTEPVVGTDTAYATAAEVPPTDTTYDVVTRTSSTVFTVSAAGAAALEAGDNLEIRASDGTVRGRSLITSIDTTSNTVTLTTAIDSFIVGDSLFEVDPSTVYFLGSESPNWLRDEQEKVLIFGALSYCFSYLGETEMEGKYQQRAQFEIDLLNEEEGKRRASGGNVQQNFNGYLI